jgi:hypothetical protein
MNTTTQQFAEEMLRTYEVRTAQDWPFGLLFMCTAGSRLQAFRDIRSRMLNAIQAAETSKPSFGGIHVEALLGEFGSGKSHITYLLLHDSLRGVPSCVVMHFQMTGERALPKVLARLLHSSKLSEPGRATGLGDDRNTLHAVKNRLNLTNKSNIPVAEEIIRKLSGPLPGPFAVELTAALAALSEDDPKAFGMSGFLDRWVGSQESRNAVEAFTCIVRLIKSIGIATRLVILLDEFEALQGASPDERSRFLQGLQDLHDDFGGRSPGLPPTFMALFSTPDFWDQAKSILPSMFNEGDRVRKSTKLGGIQPSELLGLVDRYQLLCILAGRQRAIGDSESSIRIADEVWKRVDRNPWHMRSVHQAIRELVIQNGQ